MKWQPIETAPKDGTHILVSRAGLTTKSDKPIRPPTVVSWKNQREGNYRAKLNGGWVGVDSDSSALGRPTHWMPLPADPDVQ